MNYQRKKTLGKHRGELINSWERLGWNLQREQYLRWFGKTQRILTCTEESYCRHREWLKYWSGRGKVVLPGEVSSGKWDEDEGWGYIMTNLDCYAQDLNLGQMWTIRDFRERSDCGLGTSMWQLNGSDYTGDELEVEEFGANDDLREIKWGS